MYWWFVYFMFWNSVQWVAYMYKSPCTSRVRSFLPIALFPGIWTLSIFLSPHLRTFDFWVLGGPYKSPWLTGYPKSCGGFSIALHELRETKLTGFAFAGPVVLASPPANLHWKSFLDLSLTWRTAFRSDQKENCWNGCKRTPKNSLCWTNGEDDSTRHAKNSLWLGCQRVGFWCQHIWFGSLVPNWFCQITNQAQLCVSWKHVSLWDFFPLIIILMTGSLSSKM